MTQVGSEDRAKPPSSGPQRTRKRRPASGPRRGVCVREDRDRLWGSDVKTWGGQASPPGWLVASRGVAQLSGLAG